MRVRVLLMMLVLPITSPALTIPKGLTEADRREVVRTLGMNSSSKMLTNPYPLGGYSGFEFGYSMEYVNVRDIRRVGCEPGTVGCENVSYSDETEWRYSRLTIGKGLYNDVDVYFHFVPPVGGVGMSDYGGMLRWSFYQARFLPINVALVMSGNQLNFDDTFINTNIGADLMVGVNVDNFALYFGAGQTQSNGTFIGGANCENCTVSGTDPAVNPDRGTVETRIRETHTFVGFSLHFANLFAAAEVDRYRDAVYSMKVGLRY